MSVEVRRLEAAEGRAVARLGGEAFGVPGDQLSVGAISIGYAAPAPSTGSAARRHARTMDIAIVPLSDDWALRRMRICLRSLEALPPFARDLVDLLTRDAERAQAADGEATGQALQP